MKNKIQYIEERNIGAGGGVMQHPVPHGKDVIHTVSGNGTGRILHGRFFCRRLRSGDLCMTGGDLLQLQLIRLVGGGHGHGIQGNQPRGDHVRRQGAADGRQDFFFTGSVFARDIERAKFHGAVSLAESHGGGLMNEAGFQNGAGK